MPSSDGRVTTRELAEQIAKLTEAVAVLVHNQVALNERIEAMQTERAIREDLENTLETVEQTRARLLQEEPVTVVHEDREPRVVAINGARFTLFPGENVVPRSVAAQYQNALRDAAEGERRREAIRAVYHMGSGDTYGLLDRIVRS